MIKKLEREKIIENKKNWRDDKPTPKQLSFLRKRGETAKTKGEAYDKIKKIVESKSIIIEYEPDIDDYEYDYAFDD